MKNIIMMSMFNNFFIYFLFVFCDFSCFFHVFHVFFQKNESAGASLVQVCSKLAPQALFVCFVFVFVCLFLFLLTH